MSDIVNDMIDFGQMDNVEYDILMESVERRMRQKADEINVTRKKMDSGGLMRFDTNRLCNDLLKIVAQLRLATPEAFVQTYPKNPDNSPGANIDVTE